MSYYKLINLKSKNYFWRIQFMDDHLSILRDNSYELFHLPVLANLFLRHYLF